MIITEHFKKSTLPFRKKNIFLVVSLNSLVGVTIEYLSQFHCRLQDWAKYIKTQSEIVAASIKMPVCLFIFHSSLQNNYKITFNRLRYHTSLCTFKTTLQNFFRILLTVQCRMVLCHTTALYWVKKKKIEDNPYPFLVGIVDIFMKSC